VAEFAGFDVMKMVNFLSLIEGSSPKWTNIFRIICR